MITNPVENPPFKPRFNGYKHQSDVLASSWRETGYGLFWEMGLGKTKTTIDNIVMLFLAGEIDGALIIAPKCAYLNWIYEEIPKHVPEGIAYRVAAYSAAATRSERFQVEKLRAAKDDVLDFMVINIEAIATNNGFISAQLFVRAHYTICVVDESSKIKSPSAQRSKACRIIGKECAYRRILSGTPMTRNLLDLWNQIEFLQPGYTQHKSIISFRNFYSVIVNVTAGNRTFPKIVGFRNEEYLTRQLSRITDRKTKAECLDLPAKVFETVFVEQTPAQRRIYEQLRHEALIELDQGVVTSQNALTTIMRLHQINCGFTKTDDGAIVEIESNRLDTLMDLVEDIDGKIIIWARFRHDILAIASRLRADYGDQSVVTYYGGNTTLEKIEAVRDFRNDPKCRFFVANPASAGMSITLVEAHYAIYYSYSYSLEEWLQSQDRNHRIGQKSAVTYLTLAVQGTIDMKILESHAHKQDLASTILDNLRAILSP